MTNHFGVVATERNTDQPSSRPGFRSAAGLDAIALRVEDPRRSLDVDHIDFINGWLYSVSHVRNQKIVLDFTQSRFIGARLIGVLASFAGPCEQNGCKLILCGLDESCASVVLKTTLLTEKNFAKTKNEAFL